MELLVLGEGGGGIPKHPFNKSEGIGAIVMKLGRQVGHYYLVNYLIIMTSFNRCILNSIFLFLCRRPTQPKRHD